jgi:hypothetical protein
MPVYYWKGGTHRRAFELLILGGQRRPEGLSAGPSGSCESELDSAERRWAGRSLVFSLLNSATVGDIKLMVKRGVRLAVAVLPPCPAPFVPWSLGVRVSVGLLRDRVERDGVRV